MRRSLAVFTVLILVASVMVAVIVRAGLPMQSLQPPDGVAISALNAFATDTSRSDLFSGAVQRVVPFQMLYPASAPGTEAFYVPDAEPLIDAVARRQGWIAHVALRQIGHLSAPWTDAGKPSASGPFPVIIYLPGVTGYMQMGSFQTTALAVQGYVIVTLNQPGSVAAAVLPDHQIIDGLTRERALFLVAPSYRTIREALPTDFAKKLAPEHSIVPYFAADVPLVLDRLAEINADPTHTLHELLDLKHVGVMGISLGAIVAAQACAMDARISACLMMDAPVPTKVAAEGLRQPALWISRPKKDQRLERASSGGWPEDEIAAQAETIDEAVSNSAHGRIVQLQGLFHLDFTDVPAIQPAFGWLGQSGPAGIAEAHYQINKLTTEFFSKTLGPALR